MKESPTILMATDGEAIALKGSLRFVLADPESKVLLTCYGQPAGHDPLSFQSEAYVFLTALWINFLIKEHNNVGIKESIAITSKIHIITDSKSMIKKLTAMNKYPTAHVKCTMDPEWNIFKTLNRWMNQMKERLTLEWVAVHQDDNPTIVINTLSTGTQLNIQVDKLATKELQRPHSKPNVQLGPSPEVMIHQQGRTITRDLKVSIRNNIQLQLLEKYYQQRFG